MTELIFEDQFRHSISRRILAVTRNEIEQLRQELIDERSSIDGTKKLKDSINIIDSVMLISKDVKAQYCRVGSNTFRKFANGKYETSLTKTVEKIFDGIVELLNDYITECENAGIQAMPAADWRSVESLGGRELISEVSAVLERALVFFERGNQPVEDGVLPEFQRDQLIQLLRTSIRLLESPMVEVSMLNRLKIQFGQVAGRFSNAGVDGAGKSLSKEAFNAISSLF